MSTPSAPSEANRAHLSLKDLQRIVVDAASAHTAEEQIDHLVAQVKAAMHVQVCSLYQLDDADVLRMVANLGLAPDVTERISLPLDQGLVGWVARTSEGSIVATSSNELTVSTRHPAT